MLGAALAKDLRILARDRAGLIFLTLAPIVVITVAGFSLASLYGSDPRGQTAYVLPFLDEDGGKVGRTLRSRLESIEAVQLVPVADREAARARVRAKQAGTALVIPAGTSRAVAEGRPAPLLLLTDPVKYLEVANVRALVQELRHGIEKAASERAQARLATARARALERRADLVRAARALESELAALPARFAAARAETEKRIAQAYTEGDRELRATIAERQAAMRARLAAELAPLRTFLADLRARQDEFAAWLAAARDAAGRFADRLPPPPPPPLVPAELAALASMDADTLSARLLLADTPGHESSAARLSLPAPPALPSLGLPPVPPIPKVTLPGALEIEETSVTGAPRRLNTFDQNVPGFSVTFLLLGMLLGVSMGLLDERDWGTLGRLRAMPTPFRTVLIAKLLARFAVGVVQMVVLMVIGRLAFGVSLGPQPWALLLPTVGIVFAGTAFGLVVAGAARSREAILPLGSIVIVTMASVGGCWWPIDLEPRWMQTIALGLPTTWAMAAFNDLMIRRQTFEAALVPTGVLFAYGAFYLIVGLVLFRRQHP